MLSSPLLAAAVAAVARGTAVGCKQKRQAQESLIRAGQQGSACLLVLRESVTGTERVLRGPILLLWPTGVKTFWRLLGQRLEVRMDDSSDTALKESSPDGQMHREAAMPPQQVRASCAWCRVPGPHPSTGTVCHQCPLGTQNRDPMLQCLPLLGDGTKTSPIWSCKLQSLGEWQFPFSSSHFPFSY